MQYRRATSLSRSATPEVRLSTAIRRCLTRSFCPAAATRTPGTTASGAKRHGGLVLLRLDVGRVGDLSPSADLVHNDLLKVGGRAAGRRDALQSELGDHVRIAQGAVHLGIEPLDDLL